MTRLLTDGAEFGDNLFWDVSAPSSVVSSEKRSGVYSYHHNNANTSARNLPGAYAELYFRVGVRTSNHINQVLIWRKTGTILGYIRFDTASGKYQAYTGTSTLVASGTIPITVSQWYCLEVHVKIANAGGVIETKIDGIADITFSGDTQPGADTTIDVMACNAAASGTVHIDDIAVNDIAGGAPDNTWCGDGHLVLLTPNGNGNTNQYTGQDSDSTNNYLNVDEFPHTTDTDYNQNATAGQQDMYDLTDFAGSGQTVRRAYAECRARDTVAAGGQIKIGVRTNANNYVSAAKNLLTSYTRIVGDDLVTNPNTAVAWTDGDLDAVQFIIETV